MATPRKRVSKRPKKNGRIIVKQKAELRNKRPDARPYSLPPTPTPHNNAAVFRIRINKI